MKKAENRIQRGRWPAAVLAVILMMLCTGCAKEKDMQNPPRETVAAVPETRVTEAVEETTLPTEAESEETVAPDTREDYDALTAAIEEGGGTAVAQLLLEGNISRAAMARLEAEEPGLLDFLLTDALVQYGQEDNVETFIRLRLRGYLSDGCVYDYWEVMGSRLPEENAEAIGVDVLLVHELVLACDRSEYAIRSLRQLREEGLLGDGIHEALVAKLGYDYMDDGKVQEHTDGQLHQLSAEEKAVYDAILLAADEGDCRGIAMKMVYGEVTGLVFEKLREVDGEMMDHILAQAMGSFSEENAYNYTVILRQNGFVSDECFRLYWQIMGTEAPEGDAFRQEEPDMDLYLLRELEEIYRRDPRYGLEALRLIRDSGLLGDALHDRLSGRLGFDYMQDSQ